MSQETVTLKEHLESLWAERERRIDEQFDALREDVGAIRTGVERTQADVITLKAAAVAVARLRTTDYAKVGSIAAVVGLVLPLVVR